MRFLFQPLPWRVFYHDELYRLQLAVVDDALDDVFQTDNYRLAAGVVRLVNLFCGHV